MTEYRAPVIDLFTRKRIDHLRPVPNLPEQSIYLADAVAEHYRSEDARRRYGMFLIERVDEPEQLSIDELLNEAQRHE